MLYLFFLCMTWAWAVPGQTGVWLPGASPISMGNGRVGPDFGIANSEVDSYAVRAIVGIQPKAAINLHLKAKQDISHFHLGGRYLILMNNALNLAAFNQVQVDSQNFMNHSGLAIDIPITHIRIDSAVSLLTISQQADWTVFVPPKAMRHAEFGIAANIAPRQEIRFGNRMERGQHTPNFSYRWIGSWWFVSPTVSLPNLDHIELTVNTSLRF